MSGKPVKKIIIKRNSLKRFVIPNDSNASPFIFFNRSIADVNDIENQTVDFQALLKQTEGEDGAPLQDKVICIKNEDTTSDDMVSSFDDAGTSCGTQYVSAPKAILSGQKFVLIKKTPTQNTILMKPIECEQTVDSKYIYDMQNEEAIEESEVTEIEMEEKEEDLEEKYYIEDNIVSKPCLSYKKLPSVDIAPELSHLSKTSKSGKDFIKIIKLAKEEKVTRDDSPSNDDIFCKNDPLLVKDSKSKIVFDEDEDGVTKSNEDYEELFYVDNVNEYDEEVKEHGSNDTEVVEVVVESEMNSTQEELVESDVSTVTVSKGGSRSRMRESCFKFQCSHCDKSFPKEKPYRLHLSSHVKDSSWDERPHSCWECNLLFASQEAWNKHILSCIKHRAQVKLIVNGCRFCGKTFDTIDDLEAHKSEGHSRRKRAKELKWPTPCVMCGEMQANYVHYWAHTRRAHPGEKYPRRVAYDHVCGECGKEFRCLSLLKQHENIHRGVRPYVCVSCGKGFFTPLALQMHDMTHSEKRPFVCETCGAAFKFKHNVERHQLVHTGERPYVCGECGRGFTTLHWTQMHVRKVHYNEYIPYKPRIRKNRQRKAD